MRDNEYLKMHYVSCGCMHPMCTFRVGVESVAPHMTWVEFQVPNCNTFWQRLKMAFRVLFKPPQNWSELELTKLEAKKLVDFLQEQLSTDPFEIFEKLPDSEIITVLEDNK